MCRAKDIEQACSAVVQPDRLPQLKPLPEHRRHAKPGVRTLQIPAFERYVLVGLEDVIEVHLLANLVQVLLVCTNHSRL